MGGGLGGPGWPTRLCLHIRHPLRDFCLFFIFGRPTRTRVSDTRALTQLTHCSEPTGSLRGRIGVGAVKEKESKWVIGL